jgi:hypothetical protein
MGAHIALPQNEGKAELGSQAGKESLLGLPLRPTAQAVIEVG